jgi:hypothetical protein
MSTLNWTYSHSSSILYRYMFDKSPVHILAPAVDITLFSRSLNVSSAAVLVLTSPSYVSLSPPPVILHLYRSAFSARSAAVNLAYVTIFDRGTRSFSIYSSTSIPSTSPNPWNSLPNSFSAAPIHLFCITGLGWTMSSR